MADRLLIDLPAAEMAAHLVDRYADDPAFAEDAAFRAATAVKAQLDKGSAEVTVVEMLAALLLVPSIREQVDRVEVDLIRAVIDSGVTWDQLGAVYGGRTRQAMQQHYRQLGGTSDDHRAPDEPPSLIAEDQAGDVVSMACPEVQGTWRVTLRDGCRPGAVVVEETAPMLVRAEERGEDRFRWPWPEWVTEGHRLTIASVSCRQPSRNSA